MSSPLYQALQEAFARAGWKCRPVEGIEVIEAECVGCNLCVNVCPVEGCITMEPLAAGALDQRTGTIVDADYANWTTHPNNPTVREAAE